MNILPNQNHNNIFCDFISHDNIHYECKNCGIKVKSSDGNTPVFPCQKSLHRTSDQVSFIQKLSNFAKATVGHLKEGMPMCSDEQIIKRHDICLSCEFFKDDTCSKCGCPLMRNKQFVSKLAWADQECPVGKWGKEIS
jgi:hypothetical protein